MATVYVQDTATLGSPSAGDTVIITGRATGNVTAITTSLDQSGLSAGGLAKVHVTRNFRGSFGSYSTPFKAEINTGASLFQNDAAAGELFYTPDGNTDVCVTFRQTGMGSAQLIGTGAITNLEQLRGVCLVGENITPTTIRVAGGSMTLDGAAGTNPTTINLGGDGKLRTLRGATTINLFGNGQLIIDCDTDAITTVNIYGGIFEIIQSGTITTLNLFGGDANKWRLGRALTVTNLNVWPTVKNVSKFVHHPLLSATPTWQVDQGEI